MKILKTTLAVLSLSMAVQATEFNGYIVKVRNSSNKSTLNTLKKLGNVNKVVETSFGSFVTVQSVNNLTVQKINDPNIEYIEPNWIIKLTDAKVTAVDPIDDMFKKQWGLKNTGSNGSILAGVKGEDINVTKAWDITTGSKDIKVAIIDTGIDYRHPDFKGQLDVNELELNGKPGVDDDGNGYVDDIYGYDFVSKDGDPMDGHSHGTHCSGVIGAAHNGKGIAGVMANVKMFGVKFLSDQGSGETIDAISSIEYAIKRGANVMSNSWGGGEYSEALKAAIVAANEAGIVFVAAAGNESSNNDSTESYPANYDVENVISVGSFASSGSASSFSNYGLKSVHVFAPGSTILSTIPNGKYGNMSGTSMATPHVAGIVGLVLSKTAGMKPSEVRDVLIKTSTKTSKLSNKSASGGRVNAFSALSL